MPSLAHCAGYVVDATDGRLGVVETPLFPPDAAEPDFIVVCVGERRRRRPVLPAALVASVDERRRTIALRGHAAVLAAMPEHLPIAR